MPFTLVLVPLILLFLIFRRQADDWRSALLSAAALWGLLLTLATEILSFFGKLEFLWLLTFWALVNVACFALYFKYFSGDRSFGPRGLLNALGLPFFIVLCGLGVEVLANLLIALSAPPNNWDSMTYHMARVAHWIQNGSVYHYPTHIDRQLWLNPWAEFAITHFQILSGGDRFANLVQWLSMVGSLLGVSLVAKQLGADTRQQVLAAVFAGTVPMGILQATSSQNDYVVTFWLICFLHFGLQLISLESWDHALPDSAKGGISLGLALATKGTAYVFALPFALWLGLAALKAKAWRPLAVLFVMVVAINLGHFARNLDLYGNPQGPSTRSLANETHSLRAGLSNVVRNLALHLSTPVKRVNRRIENGLRRFHDRIGIDIGDPRTTFAKFQFPTLAPNEDTSGNPIHLLLILGSLTALAFAGPRDRLIGIYSICAVASFLVFCLLFKWQVWHSRLHLPFFILMSPVVAVVLLRLLGVKLAALACGFLLVSALPWLLLNQSRPLLALNLLPKSLQARESMCGPKFRRVYATSVLVKSKSAQMFTDRPDLQSHYEAAAAFLKSQGCCEIGLHIGGDDWEYPFWDLLKRDETRVVHIEHVLVNDSSMRKACNERNPGFSPDSIISLIPSDTDTIKINGSSFVKRWTSGPVSIFMRETGGWPGLQ